MIEQHELGFEYKVSVNITLSVDDLRLIKRAADRHYDSNCRSFFSDEKSAVGNYWRNQFPVVNDEGKKDWVDPFDDEVPGDLVSDPIRADFDDVDRVSKILEGTKYDREGDNASNGMSLRIQLKKVIIALNQEQVRLQLAPLYDKKQELSHIDNLSPEQIEQLGELNGQIKRLEAW